MISETIHNIGIALIVACTFVVLFCVVKNCAVEADANQLKFMTECVKRSAPLECEAAWKGNR